MNEYHKISEGILGEDTIDKTNTQLFLELVGQYFPEAIKDGEVDFTALKEEMGEFPEVKSEHYEFTWAGKQAAKKEAQADIFGKTLKYKPQDSLNSDTTENIYIEGDNLEALKLLRRNYHGKIKMIYIDPPYNTGNDFVYRDNFTMTEEELSELSKDTIYDICYQKNPKDSAKFHTKWLNMIYPRLKVAKELLSDDGVIFVSIGQDEDYNLIKCCNDIFSESNKIGIISRMMKSGGNKGQYFSPNIEYILVYAKNICYLGYFREAISDELITKVYNQTETEGNKAGQKYRIMGLYQAGLDKRPNQRYWIECPDGSFAIPFGNTFPNDKYTGSKVIPQEGDGVWRWSADRLLSELDNNNILFKPSTNSSLIDENGNQSKWNIYTKIWLEDRLEEGRVPVDLITKWENRISSQELKDLKIPFDFAKPMQLIKYLINLVNNNRSMYILDFFSGSATTAHAVMQLNAEDGGHRKYIMVQLQEETDEKSEAYKAGYKNICEIGKERIRRAAKKIHEDNPEAVFDDGFKVFEVADTNIRWNTVDDEELTLLGEVNYDTDEKDRIDFVNGSNDIDIVYEIMLRQYNIPLTTPIEKLSTVSDRTYIFADSVVVCLESEINDELIEKLASIEPTPNKFVLRDSAFSDNIELKDVSFRKLSALIANHQIKEEFNSNHSNYTVEFI